VVPSFSSESASVVTLQAAGQEFGSEGWEREGALGVDPTAGRYAFPRRSAKRAGAPGKTSRGQRGSGRNAQRHPSRRFRVRGPEWPGEGGRHRGDRGPRADPATTRVCCSS